MRIKFIKMTENAVTPTKAHPTDAGFDLTATSREFDEHGAVVYGTGIAMEIPSGYVGLVFPRSSVSNLDLSMANAVGVIDAGYRGEIKAKFKPALLYVDNSTTGGGVGEHADDHIGTVQTDINTQSVSAHGLDAVFFGNNPNAETGRAETHTGDVTFGTLNPRVYNVGERCAQIIIIPIPDVTFEETDTLNDGERGANGYGSTGL